MAAPTEEPLRPLPLPAWFYPLCWHRAFPESERVAMLCLTCVRLSRKRPCRGPR